MTEPERTPQTAPDLEALPYPENEGGTHWEGCWRAPRHHNCAVREVISARAERDAARAEVERLRAAADKVLAFEHGYADCRDETGRALCQANMHGAFDILRAALSTEAAQ